MDKKHILFYSAIILVLATIVVFVGRSLASPVEGEVKTISIESGNYSDPGNWKVNKSADWIDSNKARIEFETNTVLKTDDTNHKDIILVMDVSGSMEGERISKAKEDAIGLTHSILSDSNNRIALIIFADESEIKSDFTNNREEMIDLINSISTYGCTNYNSALRDADTILSSYQARDDRDLSLLFLTDGYPNEETPNQVATYQLLKEKYPYMTIHGIQYEMGEEVIEEIKEISDKQWLADMNTLHNVLFEATTTSYKYDKYIVTDYINNDYFTLKSDKDIKVNAGSVELVEEDGLQKIIWTLSDLHTGFTGKMTIDVELKDEYKQNEGLYPTNLKETIESKIENEDETISITSNQTPTLKHGYKVTYYPNAPQGCNLGGNTVETHYAFEKVNKWTNELTCPGYLFKGWEITSEDKLGTKMINDDTFIMPTNNVDIKAVWTKQTVTKNMSGVVHENENTLYRVMQDYASEGIYAKEYTGPHQDSYDGSGTKPIYHWATEDPRDQTKGDEIRNKFYVKFGDYCWRMYRTTDLGGVRMIYSGTYSPINKCEESGSGISIGGYNNTFRPFYTWKGVTTYSTVAYGTDFTFNEETHKFTLTGNVETKEIHEGELESVIGLYTCKSTSYTDCYDIYKIVGKLTEDTLDTIQISYTTYLYNAISYGSFNESPVTSSLAGAGYMYGDYRKLSSFGTSGTHYITIKSYEMFEPTRRRYTTGYIADGIEKLPRSVPDNYVRFKAINPVPVSSIRDYRDMIGKFYFSSVPVQENSIPLLIVDGTSLDNLYTYYMYFDPRVRDYYPYQFTDYNLGDSITYNEETGLYKVHNIVSVRPSVMYTNLNAYNGKIFCMNGTDTCDKPQKIISTKIPYNTDLVAETVDADNLILIGKGRVNNTLIDTMLVDKFELAESFDREGNSPYKGYYTCGSRKDTCTGDKMLYIKSARHDSYNSWYLEGIANKYFYGEDVTWDGTKYHLVNPAQMDTYLSEESLSHNHYACIDDIQSTSCEKVAFIYIANRDNYSNEMYYMYLENGEKDPLPIIEEMRNGNKYDSHIKSTIDLWYSLRMTKYTDYLEDSIYCNDRELPSLDRFTKNGNVTGEFGFERNPYYPPENPSIKCNRIYDQFSVSNPYAKLKYPVGLMSFYEMALINNEYARKNEVSWITMSPTFYGNSTGIIPSRYYGDFISTGGGGYYVVPSITLKYGTQYETGDGSKTNPYMVDTSEVDG